MVLKDTSTYKFIMEHKTFIQIVEGILIIILIAGLWVMYFHSSSIQKEISENCGWGDDDYECYCQKDDAIALRNELEGREININLTDVPN